MAFQNKELFIQFKVRQLTGNLPSYSKSALTMREITIKAGRPRTSRRSWSGSGRICPKTVTHSNIRPLTFKHMDRCVGWMWITLRSLYINGGHYFSISPRPLWIYWKIHALQKCSEKKKDKLKIIGIQNVNCVSDTYNCLCI